MKTVTVILTNEAVEAVMTHMGEYPNPLTHKNLKDGTWEVQMRDEAYQMFLSAQLEGESISDVIVQMDERMKAGNKRH